MGNALQTLPQIPQQQQQEPKQPQHQSSNKGGENDEEFTCEICIEPTSYSDKKFNNNDECSHPFCTDCMTKYIRVKLEDDNAGRIRCPALSCDRTLDPRAWASLVGPPLFARWCDVLCEETIVGLNRCYCPKRDCNALIVNECGGGIVGKSKCPQCKGWFCFECGRLWHAGFACEEVGGTRDRNDVAFGRLAEFKKWMRCPRCRHFVELRNGCRVVKCRCGIRFCYRCGNQFDRHGCRCGKACRCCELCCMLVILLACMSIFLLLMWCVGRKSSHKRA